MPGKGQLYKKPMKKTMKRDPFAEGIDPSAGRGVPISAYQEKAPPKPKRKPQVVNRGAKEDKKSVIVKRPIKRSSGKRMKPVK